MHARRENTHCGTTNNDKKSQLEASDSMIRERLVATKEKSTNTTESEEDTPLFCQKLQGVLVVRFIAAVINRTGIYAH